MTNDPIFDFDSSQVPQMQALENSYTNNDLEKEIKELFLHLFKSKIGEDTFNAFVLGTPHLGSYPLVQQSLNSDGLALLNPEMAEIATRYLYRTWKSGDVQKRGLHILRIYLRLLFGKRAVVMQLQQPINAYYPSELVEFDPRVGVKDGYFLTSRVDIFVDFSLSNQPIKKIINSIQSTLPARFVPSLRFNNSLYMPTLTFKFLHGARMTKFFKGSGYLIQRDLFQPEQAITRMTTVQFVNMKKIFAGSGVMNQGDPNQTIEGVSSITNIGKIRFGANFKGIGYLKIHNEGDS